MPRDRSQPVIRWSAVVLWFGFCLGTGTIGMGCSPSAPTQADARATPARLKVMQEKGRASLGRKTTKQSSRSAPPKSSSR
jgi:hypothetical protein